MILWENVDPEIAFYAGIMVILLIEVILVIAYYAVTTWTIVRRSKLEEAKLEGARRK